MAVSIINGSNEYYQTMNSSSSTSHQNGHTSHENGYPLSKKVKVNGVDGERSWKVKASRESHDCVNPVRSCEEIYFKEALEKRDKSKELIKVSIGDPSIFGNLPPHPAVIEGVKCALECGQYHGYGHSSGIPQVREAVAKEFSRPGATLTAEDVIMTNACSGAVNMCIEVMCDAGQNILIPSPGFGLYKCLCEARGVEVRLYRLLPERQWEVDLDDLERKIDDKTAAFFLNNPSNPCGSVYSRQHLLDILALCEKYKLPIISDEIYDGMAFQGQEYVSPATLSKNVPILACGGIGKKFMVPGWRLGWILIHDRNGAFRDEVTPGLARLAMKLLGPCTFNQAALPYIFENVPQSFHQRSMDIFERNAQVCYQMLKDVPGISPIMPAGAMYMMVTVDLDHFTECKDDAAFASQMLMEQSVFTLPGMAFSATGCFRIVLVMPDDKIAQACTRIKNFCREHYTP